MERLRRLDCLKRGTFLALQWSSSANIEQVFSLNNKAVSICKQSHSEHLSLVMKGMG